MGKLFSSIFPKPIEETTEDRYFIHQIFYTLTLKKFRNFAEWPN